MDPTPDLVFYLQGSASVGMGHLSRSAALISALESHGYNSEVVLRVDTEGHAFAHNKGLTSREVELAEIPSARSKVIIDAIAIPGNDARWLYEMDQRVLISPVCDRGDIATDVLLRSLSEELRGQLSADCRVTQDDRYAYASAAGLAMRALTYDDLVIGICLSGGSSQADVGALVDAALRVPGVTEIRVIHPDKNSVSQGSDIIRHRTFSVDPWSFLAPINVFVGGSGVMIAEAVAQGLPCLSVTPREGMTKNPSLVDSGCIEECVHENAPQRLATMLTDRSKLVHMHRAARASDSGHSADALADAILNTIRIDEA